MSNHVAARVMLFSPVRADVKVLELTLPTHSYQTVDGWPSLQLHSIVYVDDCEPGSSSSNYLRDWSDGRAVLMGLPESLGRSQYTPAAHDWDKVGTHRITAIRNLAISHFLQSECTHLLMVDADLILHPNLVDHLVGFNLPIVSEVFWTKWKTGEPYLPNTWDRHPYGFHGPDSVLQLREPGLYQTGGLGACTLMRRDLFESPSGVRNNVDYSPLQSIETWGEDRHFSTRVEANGHTLPVDTHYPPFHVYRPELLDEASGWKDAGCPPDYFSQVWLTPAWASQVANLLTSSHPGTAKAKLVAFCLPGESFGSLWVNCWTAIVLHLLRRGIVAYPQFGYSSNVYLTRNAMWEELKHTGLDFHVIVWIDDDNLATPEHVDRLLQCLDENDWVGMAAGWCWSQADGFVSDPFKSFGYLTGIGACEQPTGDMDAKGAPMRVDYTGFPLVAMRGDLLQIMPSLPFLPYLDPRLANGMCGEDVAFCRRLGEYSDYKILVDPSVELVHLKKLPAGPRDRVVESIPVSVREENRLSINPTDILTTKGE